MKYDCCVIKDLLPLYDENAVSAKTREIVEEHLRSCDSCSDFLATIRKSSRHRPAASLPAESQAMRNIAKMMRRRRIRIASAIMGVVILLFVLLMVLGVNHRVWTSESETISPTEARTECIAIDISDEEYDMIQAILKNAVSEAEITDEAALYELDNGYLQSFMEEFDVSGTVSGGSYYPQAGMVYISYYDTIYGYDLYMYTNGIVNKVVRMPESSDIGIFQKTHVYSNTDNERYEKFTSRIDIWETIKANIGVN